MIIRGSIPYDSRSANLGGFVEVVRPGAFAGSLEGEREIHFLHQHDYGRVLATTHNGTLRLTDTRAALRFEAELPDTTLARDLHTSVKRGDIRGASFAFSINGAAGERWSEQSGGPLLRELLSVRLFELTVTPLPAYPATRVEARTAAAARRQMDNALRKRRLVGRLAAA